MSGLQIALLIVGILFFVGSFFFSEKLSSSDIQTIEKMSEKEVNVLVEKQLKNASEVIDANIKSRLNESLNQFDKETNKKTTEEIYSISEHGDTVRATLEAAINTESKTREEVMFLYDRLSEKQEIVTRLEDEAAKMEETLRYMKLSIEEAVERLEKEQKIATIVPDRPASVSNNSTQINSVSNNAARNNSARKNNVEEDPEVAELLKSMAEVVGNADSIIKAENQKNASIQTVTPADFVQNTTSEVKESNKPHDSYTEYEEEIARQLDEELGFTEVEEESGNINEKILALHREGFEDVEIAKQLKKGIGEIKLVLGLYDEN